MSTQPRSFLTPEMYLEIERKAERKSEYFGGEMFLMAGASHEHNILNATLSGLIFQQIVEKPCLHYVADMRVHITQTGLYTYPDLVVVCEKPQFLDNQFDTLLNPNFIAEVLSPSTEGYDLGRKFEHYRSLESLSQYLVVAQDRLNADVYTRGSDGLWFLKGADSLEGSLDLQSIGCKISMADLYRKVELPPPQVGPGELR